MIYKALYRKYRPDTFEEIVGQQPIVKTLQNIIKHNKISHAYLFNGPRGTGKTSIAKLFAKAVNCLDQKDGLACNKCQNCKYIMESNTTDIIEIDAASNNGVDEIRELKNKINLVPTNCKYKVYIIDEVHMLSIGAFNALLKTLEEPPKHAIFILATTEIHKIPLTILSRCQTFNFKKITPNIMVERLKHIIKEEKIEIEEAAIEEVASIADGGMRDAIGLLEQLNSYSDDKITLNDVHQISGSISEEETAAILKTLAAGETETLFTTIDQLYQEGKDFIRLTEKIIVFLRDLLLYKKLPHFFENKSNSKSYKMVEKEFDESAIHKMIKEANQTLTDMRISNHPKILFEIMVLKVINKENKDDNIKPIEILSTQEKVNIEETKKENNTSESILEIKDKTENESKTSELILTPKEETEDENNEYKKIIINNTLALAEKKVLVELEEKWPSISTFLVDKTLKDAATILLDGKAVAASSNRVIIIYKYDHILEKADNMIKDLEMLFQKLINRKYEIINLIESNWQDIRNYYVNLKKTNKKIEIIPEEEINNKIIKENVRKKKSKEIENAINEFGEDLIEMRG